MPVCGNLLDDMRRLNVKKAKVDSVGIGKGVVDRAQEVIKDNKKDYRSVRGINFGGKSSDPERFLNLRSEVWWRLRERFESGDIDIDPRDEDLAEQLASIQLKARSDGKIQILSKEDMRRRGIASPNKADALAISTTEPRVQTRLTFGKRKHGARS
jgi:hypothetical protein